MSSGQHLPERRQRVWMAVGDSATFQTVERDLSAAGYQVLAASDPPVSSDLVVLDYAAYQRLLAAEPLESSQERQRVEEALRKIRERFQTLIDLAPVGVYETDADGDCIYANPRWLQMAGLTLEQARGKGWVEALYQEDRERIFETWYEAARDHKEWDLEYRFQTPQGQVNWVRGIAVALRNLAGEITGHLGINTDITERKRAEVLIQNTLDEKDALLRELYHRTKNNMQIISSLLSLQEDYVDDPHLSGILRDVRSRIQAMALVHQKLYQSRSLSRLDLGEYLQDLSELLLRSYDVICPIDLDVQVESIPALIDTAIPCGLILNELITNALKYAFRGRVAGVIKLGLSREADGRICIEVTDNGVGLPAGFDFRRDGRLGFQTVMALAEMQLQGELSIQSESGLTCKVRFMDALYHSAEQ